MLKLKMVLHLHVPGTSLVTASGTASVAAALARPLSSKSLMICR